MLDGKAPKIGVAILSLASATMPGCGRDYEDHRVTTTTVSSVVPENIDTAYDLGQGVYTIVHDRDFAKRVVAFKEAHPDLRITAMFVDRENIESFVDSVVVVTEPIDAK